MSKKHSMAGLVGGIMAAVEAGAQIIQAPRGRGRRQTASNTDPAPVSEASVTAHAPPPAKPRKPRARKKAVKEARISHLGRRQSIGIVGDYMFRPEYLPRGSGARPGISYRWFRRQDAKMKRREARKAALAQASA